MINKFKIGDRVIVSGVNPNMKSGEVMGINFNSSHTMFVYNVEIFLVREDGIIVIKRDNVNLPEDKIHLDDSYYRDKKLEEIGIHEQ